MVTTLPVHLLPNLQVLRISRDMASIGSLRTIAQLSRLEEFHLSLSDISSSAMAEFIGMATSSLQYIQCNDCPNITADVIRLAQSKGITLVVRNPDPITSRSKGAACCLIANSSTATFQARSYLNPSTFGGNAIDNLVL